MVTVIGFVICRHTTSHSPPSRRPRRSKEATNDALDMGSKRSYSFSNSYSSPSLVNDTTNQAVQILSLQCSQRLVQRQHDRRGWFYSQKRTFNRSLSGRGAAQPLPVDVDGAAAAPGRHDHRMRNFSVLEPRLLTSPSLDAWNHLAIEL